MLTYFEAGAGRPIVFLHANPDCKEGWQETVELLCNEYHCIVPDLAGFGAYASLPNYRSFLPRAQSKALENLLDHIGVNEPVMIVAHDLGALMAAMFAMQKPKRVYGILTINTTFSAAYPGHIWGYLWALPFIGPAIASLMRHGLKDGLQKQSPLVAKHHVERMITNLDHTTCRAITRYYQIMYNPLLKVIQHLGGPPQSRGIPVWVLWGAGDRYIPLKYARVANEPLRLVDGCTHWLPLERPDIVAEEVRGIMQHQHMYPA